MSSPRLKQQEYSITTHQQRYKTLAIPTASSHKELFQKTLTPQADKYHKHPDLASAFQKALTQIKTTIAHREQTDPHFVSPSIFLCYAWGIRPYERFVRERLKNDLNAAGFYEVILDDTANQRGNIDRFSSQITDTDVVIVIGTTQLNKNHGSGHIRESDFTIIDPRAQRITWWRFIKTLGIITQDGSIVPNMDLENRSDKFWNHPNFPPHLTDKKEALITDIKMRVSRIESKCLPTIQKELDIIASRMQKPGFSDKTLWIIKDGNETNALPSQLAGQYPKIAFNKGQFRLKYLASIMPDKASYHAVVKILTDHEYIDALGTRLSIDDGIAETTAKTQALIENEVTGHLPQRFQLSELKEFPEKAAIEALIKDSIDTSYPHHLFALLRKINVIDSKVLDQIYNDYKLNEAAYYATIQVPWHHHNSPNTDHHHPPRTEKTSPNLIVNTDIILPIDRIIREEDNDHLVATLKDAQTRIVEIAAMGGSGKSCFTRQFLLFHNTKYGLKYEQQIWFSFYTLKSRDVMAPFEALLDLIITQRELCPKGSMTMDRRLCVQDYLNTHHTLLVLDGLEIAQKGDITQDEREKEVKADDVGRFKDPEFKAFMKGLTNNSKSHVLVSSRVPLRDLRDESHNECAGLRIFHLSKWTDKELTTYMLSGKGISGQKEHVLPVVTALGKHPLTLSLFKGMLRQDYKGQWSNAKTVLAEICSMINENDGDTDYERQLKRIRGIVRGIDKKLDEAQGYLLRILSGAYGEMSDTHYAVLAKDSSNPTVTVRVRRIIRRLLRYNIVTTGCSRGKENVTAHPMVKLGVMGQLQRDEQIAIHETLMHYFQSQPMVETYDCDEQFDELMEWAHQVVTLMRMDGTLADCGKDLRIGLLSRSALYGHMKTVMGRYVSQRGMSYLQQEALSAKRALNRTAYLSKANLDHHNAEMHDIQVDMDNASVSSQSSYQTALSETLGTVQIDYKATVNQLSKNIRANMRDIRIFQSNMDIVDKINDTILDAAQNQIHIKEPKTMIPTVFYGMYVRTITQGDEVNREPGGVAVSEVRGIMGKGFTGVAEWKRLFGLDAIDTLDVPQLPETMPSTLTSPCPFHPGTEKRVCDTHILFLMPRTLKGEGLTMIRWDRELRAKTPSSDYQEGKLRSYSNWFKRKTFANKTVSRSRWVLMPKEFIPGSENKSWNKQIQYLKDHYSMYKGIEVMELTTGIFLHYLHTGERLFPSIYARTTATTSPGVHVGIGGFDSAGLGVDDFWVGNRSASFGVGGSLSTSYK